MNEDIKIIMNDNVEYFKWVSRPGSIARDQPFVEYIINAGLDSMITVPAEGGNLDYYMHTKSYNGTLQKVLNSVLRDPESHFNEYSDKRKRFVQNAKKVKGVILSGESNKIILELFREYRKSALEFCIYVLIPHALHEFVEKRILETFPDDFQMFTSPDKPTLYNEFEKALLTETTEEILEKYKWINVYSPKQKPYSAEQIEELKKSVNVKEVDKKYQDFEKIKKEFSKFINSVKDPEIKKLCIIMHEYAFLRTDRIDAWREALYNLTALYGYVGKIAELDIYHASELYISEVESLLLGNEKIDRFDINLRTEKKGLFYYSRNENKFIREGSKGNSLISHLLGISLFITDSIISLVGRQSIPESLKKSTN